jgi:hypothetical protein
MKATFEEEFPILKQIQNKIDQFNKSSLMNTDMEFLKRIRIEYMNLAYDNKKLRKQVVLLKIINK